MYMITALFISSGISNAYLVDRDVCDIVDRVIGACNVHNLHTAGQHLPGVVTRLPPLTTLKFQE